MADEIVYKKMTRKADKGLEGKVVAKHGKQTNQKLKDHEFFIGVNLFDSFGSLVELDVQIGVAFLVTPREEDLESSCVTVDGACGQPLFTHTQNHVFQVLRVQAVHWNGYIHSLGD